METAALILALSLVAVLVVPAVRLGIGPMPSSAAARRAVVELLKDSADLPVYELGSGWGGLARRLAADRPERHIIALEASLLPFAVGWIAAHIGYGKSITCRWARFETTKINEPAVVVCYLHPEAMRRLADRVGEWNVERMVAVNFRLPGAQPTRIVGEGLRPDGPIYLYDRAGLNRMRDDAT